MNKQCNLSKNDRFIPQRSAESKIEFEMRQIEDILGSNKHPNKRQKNFLKFSKSNNKNF